MPNVSVLLCAYNSWDYIISTIKSILNQTYSDFELLILNNNSSDNTLNNISSFTDSRIKLYNLNKNLWPYKWLNFLLEKAKWKYIAIQDHDDIWHKEKLEKQILFLDNNKNYVWCWTKTVMFYEYDKKYFLYYLKKKNYYTIHPSLVFRNIDWLKYDENLEYFWDAYFQKVILCKWKKQIYNIDDSLTLHLIKKWYSNYTFSWFKFNSRYIKRIFEVHSFSLYSFFILFYEITKKIFLFFLKLINNYKLYVYFDRLPYLLIWNKFVDIKNCENWKICEMYKNLRW